MISGIHCTKNRTPEKITTIYPLSQTITPDNPEDYIDTVIIMPLEKSKESYITYISKMLIMHDKKMIILDQMAIFLFGSDGRFIAQIGRRGRGPREYDQIVDICLTPDQKYLLALDGYGHVYKYSLEDYSFIKKITVTPPLTIPYYDAICPSGENKFFLFCSNPLNYEKQINGNGFYCLYEFDEKGSFIQKLLPHKDFCFPMSRVTYSFDNISFIRPLEGDNILYKVKDGKINKYLKIDFEDKAIPLGYIYNNKGGPLNNISYFIHSPYYKLPMNFYETNSLLFFMCGGPDAAEYRYLFNKKSNPKGIGWVDPDLNPFSFIASDSIYFYGTINDYNINNNLKKGQFSLNHYIIKKYHVPLDFDANRIIKIRFKDIIQ